MPIKIKLLLNLDSKLLECSLVFGKHFILEKHFGVQYKTQIFAVIQPRVQKNVGMLYKTQITQNVIVH